MPVHFNHTIVHAIDRAAEATCFTEMFGLPPAGVYFVGPTGHLYEAITRPYGGGDPV